MTFTKKKKEQYSPNGSHILLNSRKKQGKGGHNLHKEKKQLTSSPVIVRYFFFFFFLPSWQSSLSSVRQKRRVHTPHNNPSKISPAQLYLCQNHHTRVFFLHRSKKSSQQLYKKWRESDRDRSTLQDKTESAQCTHHAKKLPVFFLTTHRKQPHPVGCESTRHHSTNTAHTEGVVPVQKQMHTALSSSDVKTTCRSLRFNPRATDRVSFLVVRKTSMAAFTQQHHCDST